MKAMMEQPEKNEGLKVVTRSRSKNTIESIREEDNDTKKPIFNNS